jgi:predicted DNA-binding WGR domain protein
MLRTGLIRLETSTHFWEGEARGRKLERRHGRLGNKGRKHSRTLGSAAAARHALRQLVKEKRSEGYEPVASTATETNAPLELDGLERDAAVMVYGDWLQGRGDPRGELVMLQHAMQNARGDAFRKLRAEHDRVFKASREQLLGPLREIDNLFELEWRLGFVQRARVVADRSGRVRDVLQRLFGKANLSDTVAELTRDLLELESVRFIESLSLESVGGRDFSRVLATVEELAPPTLRRLHIPLTRYLEASLGVLRDVDDVRGAELRRRLGEYADAAIDVGERPLALPYLRELVVDAPIGYSGATPGLELFAMSELPALEIVDLSCAARRTAADQLAGFLDAKRFPNLREIRFKGAWFARELCRMLLDSPIAAQLTCIDLSWGRLDDAHAIEIARARKRFPKLKRFTIHATDVTSRVRTNLRKVGLDIDLRMPEEEAALTDQRVVSLCADERVEAAARALAKPSLWQDLGRDDHRMWGRVFAGGLHSVVVGFPRLAGSCDCRSRKKPCKHVLAMLFLAAHDEVPSGELPGWLY